MSLQDGKQLPFYSSSKVCMSRHHYRQHHDHVGYPNEKILKFLQISSKS